jgi:DNA-binding NtrC family response regulator
MKKTNASILIIDDQEDILFTAKMLLKKHYETIYTLNNPKNVVQLVAESEIDLVLLDMNYRIGFEDGREGLYFLKETDFGFPHLSLTYHKQLFVR